MAHTRFEDVKITGVAGAVPADVVDNTTDHPEVDAVEAEKTVKLTGVRTYRKAHSDICSADLCHAAASNLLEQMSIDPGTIDALLFVTQTPDYRMPSTACILQDRLSCSTDTLAYDINLGCSGYVYGLYTACSLIRGGGLQRVLVLCGDTQTKLCHAEDKNVNFLLGDGGSATLLEACDGTSPITILLKTDGSGYRNLYIPAGGFRIPSSEETREVRTQVDGGTRSLEHMFMDGMGVFNFSVTSVVRTIQEFMQDHDIAGDQVDYMFLHQANKFMTDKIARKLKISSDRVPYSMDRYGNTSSASIPITMAHHFSTVASSSDRCILSGFGVGLSWGVADISLTSVFCPPILEYR